MALALSAAIAFTVNPPNGTQFGFADRFFSLVWAFSLPLASQVTGPDREYLRLSLDLRALNLLTLFQRASYLAGLFLAVTFFEDLFAALAVASLLSLILNAGACRWHVEKRLTAGHSETTMIRFWPTIFDSLQNFSIWNHIAGVITGWVQTLDLFFLGVFGIPAREIGTYSVILKISNFALAVPSALANLYLVRLGRMPPPSTEKQGSEIRQLVRLSGYLGAAAMFGGLVLWVIAPWGLAYLSNGRWHLDEQIRMIGWFKSIIAASVIYASILLWTGWLSIRHSYRSLVLQVYIPWGGLSCGIYAITAFKGGANWTASANILVVMLLAVLLIRFSRLRS